VPVGHARNPTDAVPDGRRYVALALVTDPKPRAGTAQ
jgi:hypothetical protein